MFCCDILCRSNDADMASTWIQVAVLSSRSARSWLRTPASSGMQAAQYLFAALLIGAALLGFVIYHR